MKCCIFVGFITCKLRNCRPLDFVSYLFYFVTIWIIFICYKTILFWSWSISVLPCSCRRFWSLITLSYTHMSNMLGFCCAFYVWTCYVCCCWRNSCDKLLNGLGGFGWNVKFEELLLVSDGRVAKQTILCLNWVFELFSSCFSFSQNCWWSTIFPFVSSIFQFICKLDSFIYYDKLMTEPFSWYYANVSVGWCNDQFLYYGTTKFSQLDI